MLQLDRPPAESLSHMAWLAAIGWVIVLTALGGCGDGTKGHATSLSARETQQVIRAQVKIGTFCRQHRNPASVTAAVHDLARIYGAGAGRTYDVGVGRRVTVRSVVATERAQLDACGARRQAREFSRVLKGR